LVVAPAVYRKLGYDPSIAFTPIATLMSISQMLAVNSALPVNTFDELVAYAKANPGKISFASPRYGTQPHLLGEMLKREKSVDIDHAPYKGPAAELTDLLAGQVQMYFETISYLRPHVEMGKLRALAIADESRSPQLPAVPTSAECGIASL